jgi:hypothetical protein
MTSAASAAWLDGLDTVRATAIVRNGAWNRAATLIEITLQGHVRRGSEIAAENARGILMADLMA